MERSVTSFRFKVGYSMHDDMMQEEGLVVHFDGARQQTAEVMDISRVETKIVAGYLDRVSWNIYTSMSH